MVKFTKTLQLRDQTDCLQSCFGKVLGGAIMKYKLKDPGSAITHFIGMLMAIFAAIPLLIKAAHEPGRIYLVSIAVYAVSLILLYAARHTIHLTFPRR